MFLWQLAPPLAVLFVSSPLFSTDRLMMEDNNDMDELPFAVVLPESSSSSSNSSRSDHQCGGRDRGRTNNHDEEELSRFRSLVPSSTSSSSSVSAATLTYPHNSNHLPDLEASILSASDESSSFTVPVPPAAGRPTHNTTTISTTPTTTIDRHRHDNGRDRPEEGELGDASTLSEEFLDAAASLLCWQSSLSTGGSSSSSSLITTPQHPLSRPMAAAAAAAATTVSASSTTTSVVPDEHPQEEQQPHDICLFAAAAQDDDEDDAEAQTQRIDNRRRCTDDESIASSTSSSAIASTTTALLQNSSSLILGEGGQSIMLPNANNHSTNNNNNNNNSLHHFHHPSSLSYSRPHSSSPTSNIAMLAGVSAQMISDDSFVCRVVINNNNNTINNAVAATTATTSSSSSSRETNGLLPPLLLYQALAVPQNWQHWCEALRPDGYVVIVSQSSPNDDDNDDDHDDSFAANAAVGGGGRRRRRRAYEGVWTDATVGRLRSPGGWNTTILEHVQNVLGCPTFGRLSLFVQDTCVTATLGPFPGNVEQRFQMKLIPDGPQRVLLETTVRIKQLADDNDNNGSLCDYWQRPTLPQHRDQVMLSLARLRFHVENYNNNHSNGSRTRNNHDEEGLISAPGWDHYDDSGNTDNNFSALERPLLMHQ
jgi:hypothetical protein